MRDRVDYICTKTIEWSLIFITGAVPLIINPDAFDVWYRPKIESVYALVIIAGAAWLFKIICNKGSLFWHKDPVTIPMLCYLAAALLSTGLSMQVNLSLLGDPMRVEGFLTLLSYGALVFLFVNQVTTRYLEDRLFIALITGAALVSIYALVQYLGFNPTEHFFYKYWRRGPGVGSTIGNQNFLGKYLVLIIPVVFSFCVVSAPLRARLVAGLSLVLCFAALIATYTRASWLSVIVGLIIFLYVSLKRSLLAGRVRAFTGCLFILIVSVALFNFCVPRETAKTASSFKQKEPGAVVKRTVSAFQLKEGRGVATRLYVWEKAIDLIKERPWFGYGLETFQIAFRPHNIDYIQRFNDFTSVDRIHNNYLDTAFSLGLTGLAAYLAIIAFFLRFLWQVIKEVEDTARKLLYIGIFSGFCGYLVNDLFIFSVVSVSPTFWSLMGLTIAAGRLERSHGGTVNV